MNSDLEAWRSYLPPRQLQILRLMAQGVPSIDIARKLFVHTNTVKTHMHRMYRHLGAHDRGHAVALGFAYGILTVEDVQAPEIPGYPVAGGRDGDGSV